MLDDKEFAGSRLDVQVPERYRCDLSEKDIQRRLSGHKHILQSTTQGAPMPAGQILSGSRVSFGRHNSIRKFRTNSQAHSEGSGRRNSLFSPQDARSDLPELPDIPEAAKIPYPPIAEAAEGGLLQEVAKTYHGQDGSTKAPSELR
jgi:hypothetical protein